MKLSKKLRASLPGHDVYRWFKFGELKTIVSSESVADSSLTDIIE